MKPRDFLEWYPYRQYGSKRMYQNYKLLRSDNPDMFEKLKKNKKFKYDTTMGEILDFPKEKK